MAKKKDAQAFQLKSLGGTKKTQTNILDEVNSPEPTESVSLEPVRRVDENYKTSSAMELISHMDNNDVKPKRKSRRLFFNKKTYSFFLDERWEPLIERGRLVEMQKSKSDYLDHIFKQYFESKPFTKELFPEGL